ncbi:helix-turn-helix domain-containing protein [Actinoplanes sp. CA-252034]|uniref:helix-turn-helix domain-containing protein n=1 Tax=Actinoplanes sp. CA-252034 TaxID=3239906 RepID=UPI003D988C36
MTSAVGNLVDPEEPVGVALGRLRRAAGLSGAQLGARVNMSQPKVSRIERGVGALDPTDVAVLAAALGADEALTRSLVERAWRSHDKLADWRPAPVGLAGAQHRVREWESAASEVFEFQPALVSGLLQTSGYARAVLSSFQQMIGAGEQASPEPAIAAAVSARIRRQEALADSGKVFHFVFLESVLSNRPCSRLEMLTQISHLTDANRRHANIDIRVIPQGTVLVIPPMHGFALYGDDILAIDSFNTGLTSRGRADLKQYRYLFDHYAGLATSEVEPILSRYRSLYLEQLRQATDE